MGRFINADGQISGVGGEFLGYNQFAYCFNNPQNMSDTTGDWPNWIGFIIKVVVTIVVASTARAGIRNMASSRKNPNYNAVDKMLENSNIATGNVKLPEDNEGLLYNKENREYASQKVKEKLGPDTKRTEEDISSEIFAHIFIADVLEPFEFISNKLPPEYDVCERLSFADINEEEDKLCLI